METLTTEQAAEFLHLHPDTLVKRARNGVIPGSKPGKRWVFLKDDLIQYLRIQCSQQASQGANGGITCQFTPEKIHHIGGLSYQSTVKKSANLLGLQTES